MNCSTELIDACKKFIDNQNINSYNFVYMIEYIIKYYSNINANKSYITTPLKLLPNEEYKIFNKKTNRYTAHNLASNFTLKGTDKKIINIPTDLLTDLLDILQDVHKVLEEANIPYVLIAGTLLGQVRHGGFIPWDDDIDIGISSKDDDKLFKIDWNKYGMYIQRAGIGARIYSNTNNNFCDIFHIGEIKNPKSDKYTYGYTGPIYNNISQECGNIVWTKEFFPSTIFTKRKLVNFEDIQLYIPDCDISSSSGGSGIIDLLKYQFGDDFMSLYYITECGHDIIFQSVIVDHIIRTMSSTKLNINNTINEMDTIFFKWVAIFLYETGIKGIKLIKYIR